jgi:hypothetical protein
MRRIFHKFPSSLTNECIPIHPRKAILHPEQRELRQNEMEAELAQSFPMLKIESLRYRGCAQAPEAVAEKSPQKEGNREPHHSHGRQSLRDKQEVGRQRRERIALMHLLRTSL